MHDTDTTTTSPAPSPTPPSPAPADSTDPQIAKLRKENATARERFKTAEAERAAVQAQLDDLSAKVNGKDAERAEAKRQAEIDELRAKIDKANTAVINSTFDRLARDAGADPDALDAVRRAADLSGVTVDGAEVSGVAAAVESLKSEVPQLFQSSNRKPGVTTDPPGSTSKSSIDLKNIQPGDMTRLMRESPEEYDALMKEGIDIPTGRFVRDADGKMVKEMFRTRTGGNSAQRNIDQARSDWKRQVS